MATRKKTRKKHAPGLRVFITGVAGDEPLIFDFQMKRRPREKRVRDALEAFKEKLLNNRASS